MAFLQLTGECNLDCVFCRPGKTIRRQACSGCRRTNQQRAPFGADDWARVVKQLRQLDCALLVLGGGNCFMAEDTCALVVGLAAEAGFKAIRVVTNGTILSDRLLEQLTRCRVDVIVQVYTYKGEIHDAITRKRGSFSETRANLRRMRDAGLRIWFTLLVLDVTEEGVSQSADYFKTFSPAGIMMDYLYPNADGETAGVPLGSAQNMVVRPNSFGKVTLHGFYDALESHNCLKGKVAVSPDGFLLPCPAMEEQPLGDLRGETVQSCFAEHRLDPYWQLTKDRIVPCGDCEFRYACLDCRALHFRSTGDLHGSTYCLYNPATGEWRTDPVAHVLECAGRTSDERSRHPGKEPHQTLQE